MGDRSDGDGGVMLADRGRAGLAARPGLWRRVDVWRWTTAAALLAALLLLALDMVLLQPRLGASGYVAVLNDAQANPAWLIEASPDSHRLTVDPLAEEALTAEAGGHALELWILPQRGGAPVSLGLVDPAETRQFLLPPDLAARLPQAAALAVSLEPPGGSKTGMPTGPVLHSGGLIDRTN